jgi:histidine triad (HIT) family protein
MNTGPQEKCVFCEIVAGRAPAHIVHQDALSLCLLDIHPFTQGHCLVISKRHVPWWHDLSPEENASLFQVAQSVADRMMKKFKPDFVCLYARGRRIPHTHLFLVPTFSGDVLDRFFNALEGFQESPQALARLKDPEAMIEAAERLKLEAEG